TATISVRGIMQSRMRTDLNSSAFLKIFLSRSSSRLAVDTRCIVFRYWFTSVSPKTGFSFEYSNPNRWLMMNLASEMTVNTTGNIRINRMANGIAIASIIFLELMMKKLLEKNSTVYRI